MNSKRSDRRRFLKNGVSLAGLAMGAVGSASADTLVNPRTRRKLITAYGERSSSDTIQRVEERGMDDMRPGDSPSLCSPIHELVGIITPAPLHYVNNHGYAPIDIDPTKHRLMIHGMVDRPIVYNMDEIHRLPSVSRIHFLECGGNTNPIMMHDAPTVQLTHGMTSCSEWTGVLFSTLLGEAGVQKGASWIVVEAADRYYVKSIPLAKAMDDVILAYGQNGEPVRPENGFPLKMVVPGWEGMANIKHVRRIKVVDSPYMDKWESTVQPSQRPDGKARWFQYEQGPISVITRPNGSHQLAGPGFYEVTGLAWSGGGSIRRVEVSTDGGKTYRDAELPTQIFRKAHTRFRFNWSWDGEEAVLQSRCTDDAGQVQPSMADVAKVWGVNMEFFRTRAKGQPNSSVHHFNAIWPWKVTKDGSVHNALYA